MNRKDFLNDPLLDQKRYLEFEKAFYNINKKIEKLFWEEFKKDPQTGKYILHACIFSPISFAFNIFDCYDKVGIEPAEDYPSFMKVYSNYLKIWSGLEEYWGKVPFKEFIIKYQEAYEKAGHIAMELGDENE